MYKDFNDENKSNEFIQPLKENAFDLEFISEDVMDEELSMTSEQEAWRIARSYASNNKPYNAHMGMN